MRNTPARRAPNAIFFFRMMRKLRLSMGSEVVSTWVAQLAFWTVLLVGVLYGELHKWTALGFVLAWVIGYVGLPRVSTIGGPLVTPYVAALDIVLVFLVFKGDVPLR
jgi:hypothetical protein